MSGVAEREIVGCDGSGDSDVDNQKLQSKLDVS